LIPRLHEEDISTITTHPIYKKRKKKKEIRLEKENKTISSTPSHPATKKIYE
jgi:hypothetical protein